jgi:hypothetical protein
MKVRGAHKHTIFRVILVCSALALASLAFIFHQGATRPTAASETNIDPVLLAGINSEIKDGDIIFRKGRSLVSSIVMLNDKETDYSHVGICCKTDNEMFVIHAVPGEPDEQGNEKIRCDKLSEFLTPDKASIFAFYRLTCDTSGIAAASAANAMEYYRAGLPFDKALNFRNDDKLYCTELVWKAYLKSGINITGNQFKKLNLNILTDSIILPGHIQNSALLTKIYPHN